MPKISALGTISQLTTSSILPVVDNNETQKVTLKRIVEFVSASIDVTFATEIELLQSASSITSSLNAFASSSILSVNSKLSTSSFEAYTASVQSVNTSSLLLSSSFNTFTSSYKTDSSSFDSRIDNLELINVTPFLSSSTFNTFTSSYVNHSSSIDSRLDVLEEISITPFLSASTFNSYTSSNESKWSTLGGQTGSYILSSQTSSFITEAETGSFLTSLPNGLISGSGRIVELGFATTSSVLNIDTSSLVTTSSFNTFTSSLSGVYSSSIQLTGSFVRNSLTSSMFVGYSNLVNTQNSSTNGEFSLVFVASGSNGYLQTYTDNLSNILYNPSTNRLRVDYISGSIQATNGVISGSSQLPSGLISGSSQISGLGYATTSSVLNIDTSSLVTTSSFNTYTASISTASLVNRLNQIESVSGSWITESETSSFALTANLPVVTPFLSSSIFNTFTSSVNTSISSINGKTGSYATTGSNTFIGNQIVNGSINAVSGLQTNAIIPNEPSGTLALYGVNQKIQIYPGSNISGNNRSEHYLELIGNLELLGFPNGGKIIANSITASIAANNGVISGSSQLPSGLISGSSQLPSGLVSGSSQVLNSSNVLSSSVEGFSAFSSSVNSRINSAGGGSTDVSMFLSQSVFNTFATSSFMTFTASVNTFTSSANTALSNVYTATASLNSKTGSYATTGSNQFSGSQSITGSLTVTSLTTISSSISANSSSLYLGSGSNLYVQDNALVEITGSLKVRGVARFETVGGDEGGEIEFGVPQTNTTLSTRVVADIFQNRFRIFDGNTNGVYVDLSKAPNGVNGEITWKVSGYVNAGTFVQLDNVKVTIPTSGNRGASIGAVSTSFTANISATFGNSAGVGGNAANTVSYTTTASASAFGWNFGAAGDSATYILNDTTNSRVYRIITMIGTSYNNNFISIERLH